jgi:hypothetical protein
MYIVVFMWLEEPVDEGPTHVQIKNKLVNRYKTYKAACARKQELEELALEVTKKDECLRYIVEIVEESESAFVAPSREYETE